MRQLLCGDDNNHRVPLLGVDEVGEEYGVPDEEVGYFCHNLLRYFHLMKKMGVLLPTMSQFPSSV